MIVYKRSLYVCIKSLILYVLGIFVLFIILYSLIPMKYNIIVTGIFILIFLYVFFINDNIKFILEDNILSYYEGKKLVYEFNLDDVEHISYELTRKSGTVTKLNLIIDGESIDCEPLGLSKFYKLYEDLLEIKPHKSVKLKVEK